MYFTWDGFGEVNVMKICSGRILFTNVTLPHVSHITVLCIIKLSVKSIVAHDVKADRLS